MGEGESLIIKRWNRKPIVDVMPTEASTRKRDGSGTAYFDGDSDTWKLVEKAEDVPPGANTERFSNGSPLGNFFSPENRATALVLERVREMKPGEKVGIYSPEAAKSLLGIVAQLNQEAWNALDKEYRGATGARIGGIEAEKAALTVKLAEYNSALARLG